MNVITAYILIIFIHVGPHGDGNSVAVTTAVYANEKACDVAGKKAVKLVEGTVKKLSYVCTAVWDK